MSKAITRRAGLYRLRFYVERFNQSGLDKRGQPEGAWHEIARGWCRKEDMRYTSTEVAQQLYHEAQVKFETPMILGDVVTKLDRLIVNGRTYPIEHVDNPGEENLGTVFYCRESQ